MANPSPCPYTVLLLIPTGIGAAIGGYAGDGIPIARAMAAVADRLITHPNVLNGAQLYWPLANALYVEGYGLDRFAVGAWGLRPVRKNRVALVVDRGLDPDQQVRHRQAAEAARATLGLSLLDQIILTDQPLGSQLLITSSGASCGTLAQPDSLLRAAEHAFEAGADAVAVVARFPDWESDPLLAPLTDRYAQGQGVDPIAGLEAIISHLVVRQFGKPCAHAPAFAPFKLDPHVHPRAAAEELGHTFLPCVLVGLSRAPQFVVSSLGSRPGDIWANEIDAVVVPASACGGAAVLALSAQAQIIAVEDNTTTMEVDPDSLGIRAIQVKSYPEALGILAAHKAGIDPVTLYPEMAGLKLLDPGAYPDQPPDPAALNSLN